VGSWQVGMGRSCSDTSWAALMTMAFMLGIVGVGGVSGCEVVEWRRPASLVLVPFYTPPRPSPQSSSPGHEVAGARGSAVVCPCLLGSSAGEPLDRNGSKRGGAELHPTCHKVGPRHWAAGPLCRARRAAVWCIWARSCNARNDAANAGRRRGRRSEIGIGTRKQPRQRQGGEGETFIPSTNCYFLSIHHQRVP
jgi:hypothetical protein